MMAPYDENVEQAYCRGVPSTDSAMMLPRSARCYALLVSALGLGCLGYTLGHWQTTDLLRWLCFLALALPAASLKIWLPGVTGTMSVSFLFVLIALVQFSQPEAVVIAVVSVLVQCLWRTKKRPHLLQVSFNVGSMAITAVLSHQLKTGLLEHLPGLQEPLRILLLAVAYFVANTFPVAVVISLTERKRIRQTWRDCYYWSFPYYLVGAALVTAMRLLERTAGWQASLTLLPVAYVIYRSYRLYTDRLESEKRQADEQRQHASEMAALHLRTIQSLALAIEAKDQTTGDHLQRVQLYAMEIGKELGLSELELDALRAASLLHDIGKLAVPEHIISKPGKLTPEEFEKMKIHPVVGAEILEHVQFPYPVVPIVRSHHEKWNGTGYPDGLKGEQIPIGARILSAVDCLDALASDRQYRRALPLEQAVAVVVKEAGTSFDPQVVEILARRYRELEAAARGATVEKAKLSTDVKIERGDAPAAGFEQSVPVASTGIRESRDFLTAIAAARQEAQTLFELSQNLGNSLSLQETLSMLLLRLKPLVPHDGVAVYLRRDEHLQAEFVSGDDFRLFSSLSIPVGQGLSGWVAENKMPIINGNPSVEPGYLNDPSKFSTLRSALAVPLEGLEGVIGVLTLYHAQKDFFTKDHLRVLLAISAKVGLSIENTLRFRQAETSATNDFLTGLPNLRSLFLHLEGEMARSRDQQQPLAILVGDLNGFKQVNDRFGHLEGNRLLQEVARALKQASQPDHYVARIGGDEFVIALPNVTEEQIAKVSEQSRRSVEQAGRALFHEELLSLSLGSARFPQDGSDAEQLLAAADRRMYKAKRSFQQRRQEQSLLRLAAETTYPAGRPGNFSSLRTNSDMTAETTAPAYSVSSTEV